MSESILTPATINRTPQGLLGFFGIKNGGENPQRFGTILQPVLDLGEWYRATNRIYARQSTNVAATGGLTYFTVPQSEAWFINDASFVTNLLTAGQTLAGAIAYVDPSGLNQVLASEPLPAATVGITYTARASRFWLMPGESLQFYTTQLVAGPIVAPLMSISYVRAPL
jgi:hypothetical protein